MDKKLSGKQIKEIIKHNKYENSTIDFKCGDSDIKIVINPCVDYDKWFSAINAATGLLMDVDTSENPAVSLGITSIAYKYALVVCFTNIGESVSNGDIIKLVQYTDIGSRIKDCLPSGVEYSFNNDFIEAENHTVKYATEYQYIEAAKSLKELVSDINHMGEILNTIPAESLTGIANLTEDIDDTQQTE